MVDPGATATSMRAEVCPGEDQTTLRTPEQVAEIFVTLAETAMGVTGQIFSVSMRPGSKMRPEDHAWRADRRALSAEDDQVVVAGAK